MQWRPWRFLSWFLVLVATLVWITTTRANELMLPFNPATPRITVAGPCTLHSRCLGESLS